ncbi:hypothetical protein BH11PSE8_BH11PSE8_20670 [soil metagenome]
MGTDEKAIRELHAAFNDAVNAADLACVLGLMADDAMLVNPGSEPFGKSGFSAGFSAGHAQSVIRCVSELEEVVVVGDMAYTRSRDSLSVTPRAGGDLVALAGHRLTIYRRQPGGRWLLSRDAHTLVPQAG